MTAQPTNPCNPSEPYPPSPGITCFRDRCSLPLPRPCRFCKATLSQDHKDCCPLSDRALGI